MNVFQKKLRSRYLSRATVLTLSSCVWLLSADWSCGQSFYQRQSQTPAQPPRQTFDSASAWQPPVRQASAERPPQRQAEIQQATKLAPLLPPRDIFTRSASVASAIGAPAEPISRLPAPAMPKPPSGFQGSSGSKHFPSALGNFSSRTTNGLFDSINAVDDDGQQPRFAQANLEAQIEGLADNEPALGGVTAAATTQLSQLKNWVGQQTSNLFSGLKSTGWQARLSKMFGGADVKKIIGGLAIVIGGYLGLVWLLRMINPGAPGGIPREVLEVVGSVPLNNRQQLQLVRLGSKLLLMMHSSEGTQSMAEVTDPAEVDHLLELCGGRSKRTAFAQPISKAPATAPTPDGISQLLRALETHQGKGHVFEA